MCLGLLILLSFGLVPLTGGEQAKKDSPPPEDNQVVSSKATRRPAASSVNFRKDLNLPFASLGTLGSRIEAARRAPDPVALAHAANELAVAEKVSGKTASVTSVQLINEAAELASLRRQEAELQAVLKVSNQIMTAEDRVKSLQDQIELAKAQTKADIQAQQQNTAPTSAPRQVVVNNYTTQYLDIYVNGYYKTQVQPGATQVITVEHRWNPTVLKAYGDEDINTGGPRYIWGKFTKYTWNIN
jgi:hypothetical protein